MPWRRPRFLASLWPRLRGRDGLRAQQVAAAAALIALATTLVLPPGLPVLLAAAPRCGPGCEPLPGLRGGGDVIWVGVLLTCGGCYLLKLAGFLLPLHVLERPAVQRVALLLPSRCSRR